MRPCRPFGPRTDVTWASTKDACLDNELPPRLVRFVGGRRRCWEPPWVLQMQRKRPNTRNITLTRAGGARSGQDAGRRRHLMPLVNCGEGGGKRQIAKRINCERRGKWQSYEPRERRREEGGREGRAMYHQLTTQHSSLPGLLAWRLEERASLSLFRRSTWGMFKINKERSGGPPSIDHDDRWNDRQMMTKVIVPPSPLPSDCV